MIRFLERNSGLLGVAVYDNANYNFSNSYIYFVIRQWSCYWIFCIFIVRANDEFSSYFYPEIFVVET